MSTTPDDGWIEWHGGECPVPDGVASEVQFRTGARSITLDGAHYRDWRHYGGPTDIVRYRTSWPDGLKLPQPTPPSGSKYRRQIIGALPDGAVDVYSVLTTFAVTCPARAHAVKKLLCAGLRGKGDVLQDLREARDAIDRAIQIEGGTDK